jgi:hypothetical protein
MLKSLSRLFLLLLITLPALAEDMLLKNTRLELRLDQSLGSDISQTGQSFSGTLSRAVPVGGKESIPKGSHLSGVVKTAESTENYYRPGLLELELTSLTANGKTYRISTNTLRFQGKERQMDPVTGKQDDRGARAEDVTRAGIGVIGGANTTTSHRIPGTDISAGPSTGATGMQIILPAKSKLVFSATSGD